MLSTLFDKSPWLMLGDCLERMKEIPDGSVDMIAADLPYQTTACHWDSLVPFEPLWTQYKRVIKPNGAIVLTASQPFTTALISSNTKDFRYAWVWNKIRPTNFMSAKRMPLLKTEDICVFSGAGCNSMSKHVMPYNPQGIKRADAPVRINPTAGGMVAAARGASFSSKKPYKQETTGYPQNILEFMVERGNVHPTQKPVPLFEYLIRTYTNPDEIVLDNCFGSGTTGVASINTGRRFIGIERDPHYFDVGRSRIDAAIAAAAKPAPLGGLFDAQAAE